MKASSHQKNLPSLNTHKSRGNSIRYSKTINSDCKSMPTLDNLISKSQREFKIQPAIKNKSYSLDDLVAKQNLLDLKMNIKQSKKLIIQQVLRLEPLERQLNPINQRIEHIESMVQECKNKDFD